MLYLCLYKVWKRGCRYMDNIEVSVYCLSYNCVNFIEKAIDGIVNQKTNFNYKLIIHDDASSDGTADVIRKKVKEYPEKIYAILQERNQYSRGINILKEYLEPNVEGDFVAICEGDDCWIDNNKLQLQYDFMNEHPECSLCTHNTIDYDLASGKKGLFNHWEACHELTVNEVFESGGVHTSSYFLRKSCADWPGDQYWFGDYMMLTWAFYRGKVFSLPQVMSIYNRNNTNGFMHQLQTETLSERNKKRRMKIEYLHEFNQITQCKYSDIVKRVCESIEYHCSREECDFIILHSKSKKDCIKAAQKMSSQEYYKNYIKSRHGFGRIMARFNYEGYFCYPLWKLIKKLYPIIFKN
ncbi:glycosyltransferase [bacterium C-53]|nr:glycosyltransferase [Lachnospiraceae bacterium]NBI02661.1 glycosyltransferase [Lachnospiraceae bacterium]RKJ11300.1 glycosyltransferase [bacterium C-53]